MILNPVIQGSTEEKVYKVTDEVTDLNGATFPAGAIVKGSTEAIILGEVKVQSLDKTDIPNHFDPSSRVDSLVFVMPAQDVRIYEA